MELFIGYQTALRHWRLHERDWGQSLSRAMPKPGETPRRTKDVRAQLSIAGLTRLDREPPLHLVVASREDKGCVPGIRFHVQDQIAPKNVYLDSGMQYYVSSPEACFLQMARVVDAVRLVEIGFELCGTYALVPTENGIVREERRPRATVSSIAAFLEKAPGAYGIANARRALRFVLDGSASPMETKLAMLLCLPTVLGGYALPKPLLNASLAKGSYRCDLFWPEALFALEYDSDEFHSGREKLNKDAMRRVAIESNEVHVVSVVRSQLGSAPGVDELATLVANNLGLAKSYTRKDLWSKRAKLRRMLFSPKMPLR